LLSEEGRKEEDEGGRRIEKNEKVRKNSEFF
jgi:hypothetical protein